jgi:hypothetical protein
MAQTTAVITQSLPNATGSVDFTSSGFGTPTAAIILYGDANTTNNPQASSGIGVGFWDGTNVRTMSVWAQDAAANSTTRRLARTDVAVALVNNTSSWPCSYTISNITDGVRLTLSTDNTTLDRYATVILLKGVSAKVLSLTTDPTVDTGTTSASLGFAPDLILTTCIGFTGQTPNSGSTQTNTVQLSFGLAASDGTHRMSAWAINNATSSEQCAAYFSETYCAGQISTAAGLDYGIEITSWAADDFTATTRVAGSESDLIYVLALGGADLSFLAGTITTATSTGAVDTTTTGINPTAVLLGMTSVDTAETLKTNAQANSYSIGAASSSVNAGFAAVDEDNAGTSNAEAAYSATDALYIRASASGSTSDLVVADVTPGTGKFTIDYTTVSATARKGWYLAFGTASGGTFQSAWARGCNTVISSGARP